MERDFDELKMAFSQKRTSVLHLSGKNEKGIPVLAALKTGYAKTILMFVMTALVIVLVDQLSSASIRTSAAGFRILLGCALYYALTKVYLLYRLGRVKPTLPVLQAIEQLERYQKLNTVMLSYGELLYAIVLSIGVYLYIKPLMPFFEKENPGIIPLVLGAYILWTVIYTLVIKRKQLRKELRIVEAYIQTLKHDR